LKEEPFDYIKYKDIGLDQLIVYSIYRILRNNEECTFERLVFEAFTLFPEKFKLKRYPQWPNSALINKAWLRCRSDRGWITGSVKKGFELTHSGEIIAKKIDNLLKKGHSLVRKSDDVKARERYEAIILYVKLSNAYKEYLKNNILKISDAELISFLGGTLETPKRILRQNLNLYIEASKAYKEESIMAFLIECKEKLKSFGGNNE